MALCTSLNRMADVVSVDNRESAGSITPLPLSTPTKRRIDVNLRHRHPAHHSGRLLPQTVVIYHDLPLLSYLGTGGPCPRGQKAAESASNHLTAVSSGDAQSLPASSRSAILLLEISDQKHVV